MTTATKGSILIIEDNLLNLDMASELLEIAGFQTFQAEDAITGIKMAQEIKPDLILMDLHLPYKDGFAATQSIKSDPELRDIPIVAFTALAMREDQEKALAHGCSSVICKPIDVNHFAEKIEETLEHEREKLSRTAPLNGNGNHQHAATSPTVRSTPILTGTPDNVTENTSPSSSDQVQPTDIASHKVMVVDDNPMNVELLKDALESMGQETITAYSGQEALKLVSENQPDLILLDIMMPDMDGYEVLNRLKNDPSTLEIPVIFISALNKTQDMVRGFKQGTYDYITKPFKIEEVKARVLSSLRIKDLQDTLRKERDKLNAIFQFSADGIALLGPSLEVVSANPQFGRWFDIELMTDGRPQGAVDFFQLVGCQCDHHDICPLHTANLWITLRDNVQSAKSPVLQNAIINGADGKPRYLNIHAGKVHGSGHRVEGYVVVIRDITEEINIQKSKETFVATLTHDLKTPIRAEYQALELLSSESFGPLTEEQREILKEIIQSNRYMSRLVDSLLTTYKYEEGKMELKLESTDLNTLILKDVAPPLKTLATQKNQQLVLDLDEMLPQVLVDPIEIQRVLNNFVQNALSFTPDNGTITLRTLCENDKVIVHVQDTGQGIEPENLVILFDRFKSMAKKFQQVGTGLGLYLSKKIVEAHGGEVGVESEIGRGSDFYFSLPVEH